MHTDIHVSEYLLLSKIIVWTHFLFFFKFQPSYLKLLIPQSTISCIQISVVWDELSRTDCITLTIFEKHGFKGLENNQLFEKSEATVERISVCNVVKMKLMEHGLHCLPRSYTNDFIDLSP